MNKVFRVLVKAIMSLHKTRPFIYIFNRLNSTVGAKIRCQHEWPVTAMIEHNWRAHVICGTKFPPAPPSIYEHTPTERESIIWGQIQPLLGRENTSIMGAVITFV